MEQPFITQIHQAEAEAKQIVVEAEAEARELLDQSRKQQLQTLEEARNEADQLRLEIVQAKEAELRKNCEATSQTSSETEPDTYLNATKAVAERIVSYLGNR